MILRWESGDVTDCAQDGGCSDRADPSNVTQTGPEADTAAAMRFLDARIWVSKREMSSTSSVAIMIR